MSSFGCRAAPLGAVAPAVVRSIFLASPVVRSLGDRALERAEALRPLAERVMDAGEVPKLNTMGLPWPHQ